MAYFPNLAPYAYSRLPQLGVVHIGWLDNTHDFPKGTVPPRFVEKLKLLALNPVELYRGFHVCELCHPSEAERHKKLANNPAKTSDKAFIEQARACTSCGEIRVRSGDITYAAPMSIPHYIEAHNYLPPEEFLRAVEAHTLSS